jgi:nuclear transport factor 2 (NTF2) superfamily protein
VAQQAEFTKGRKEIVEFLKRKWAKELDYRLIKEMFAFPERLLNFA